ALVTRLCNHGARSLPVTSIMPRSVLASRPAECVAIWYRFSSVALGCIAGNVDGVRRDGQTTPRGGPRMSNGLREFREFRERMNKRILEAKNLQINRFFTLDGNAYEDGAIDARTKEFAGLAASMVLRCDDCIAYHVIRCKELGATNTQMMEIFN